MLHVPAIVMWYALYCQRRKRLHGKILALQEKIMKKKLFTTAAVAALVLAFGAGSAFANGKKIPESNFPKHRHEAHGQIDLSGTVSAVNTDSKTLTVTDADGKETQVHVNPLTKMNSFSSGKERKSSASTKEKEPVSSNEERKAAKRGSSRVSLSDVQSGDFVAVKRMGGNTQTVEASRITVVKEK
mgnify:CR=1 FL=1